MENDITSLNNLHFRYPFHFGLSSFWIVFIFGSFSIFILRLSCFWCRHIFRGLIIIWVVFIVHFWGYLRFWGFSSFLAHICVYNLSKETSTGAFIDYVIRIFCFSLPDEYLIDQDEQKQDLEHHPDIFVRGRYN